MLKVLLKSAQLFKQQQATLPQTLIFFVTSRCNARCSFCLYHEQVGNPVAAKEELSLEEVKKIAQSYGKLHYLAISGGEPFIRKDIAQLCQAFIDNCETQVIDIPSNFFYGESLVNSINRLVSDNPSVIVDMQLSLDNFEKKHDESRRVKGLYQKAKENFAKLKELQKKHGNLRLKINVVYLKENREDLEGIFSGIINDFKFDRIQLTYPTFMVYHDMQQNKVLVSDIEEFIETEARLDKKFNFLQKRDIYTLAMRSVKEVYHHMLRDVPFKKNIGSYCEVGRHILVINEKGDIFPCEPLWHKVANLRENDYRVSEVVKVPAMKDFRKNMLGEGKCNCTWGCAIHTHISVTPAILPRLGWIALKKLFIP